MINITERECQAIAGFARRTIEVAALRWNAKESDIFAASALAHLNISYEALAFLLPPFLPSARLRDGRSRQSMERMVLRSYRSCPQTRCYAPEERFCYEEPLFPYATCIIDGVCVPCRGGMELYNDKNKQKSILFQVMTLLNGRPLAWSLGEEGARTDAFASNGWEPFPHRTTEVILADTMYQANAHCVTPARRTGKKCDESDEQYGERVRKEELYEAWHRKVRSRVELLFGNLDRHRMFHYNIHGRAFIDQQVNFIMHMECIRWEVEQKEGYAAPSTDPELCLKWLDEPRCDCCMAKSTVKHEERDTVQYRNNLQDAFYNMLCKGELSMPENKHSAHSKLGTAATYTAKTRNEQRRGFSDKRLRQKRSREEADRERNEEIRDDIKAKREHKKGINL